MKTILITGINGFLGSHLAKLLSKENNIIGLEYSLENLFRLRDCSFEIYSSQSNNLADIFRKHKIDLIIHTATVYRSPQDSINKIIDTNIILPVKLFELGQIHNIEAFVNTDSFFNNSSYNYSYLGEYTLSKRHCIDWLTTIQKDTKLINMKIFHMYGPNDAPGKFVPSIIKRIKDQETEIELTKGEQTRDFIYIDDVAHAFRTICLNIHRIKEKYSSFDVGTGNSTTIRHFVELIKEILGSNSILRFGNLNYRHGEIMRSESDISKLKLLGWKPSFKLVEGLSNTIDTI